MFVFWFKSGFSADFGVQVWLKTRVFLGRTIKALPTQKTVAVCGTEPVQHHRQRYSLKQGGPPDARLHTFV